MDSSPNQIPHTGTTRRRLLGGAAAAGLGVASLALPPNVRKAMAATPHQGGHGSLKDIKHVVVLMQENRSFDHDFGALAGVRGFEDPHAIRISNGHSVLFQPDPSNPDGYLLPYRLNTKISAAQAIPSTSHAWEVQHAAWNGGKMDSWLPATSRPTGRTTARTRWAISRAKTSRSSTRWPMPLPSWTPTTAQCSGRRRRTGTCGCPGPSTPLA
jgi:phospholipase C